MWLNITWFILYVVIISGYAMLDGFDLGVGILSPFIARTDHDKRLLLNSIGPIWDGNEVWLVLAGGALFAAFPLVYASLFSGFYIAMMLVLLVLILRAAAIEFRSKTENTAWRTTWDWFFFGSSLGITLLLGVALGNVVRGVPLDSKGVVHVDFLDLLNPYALLVGVTGVAMFSLHGAFFLTQKLEGDLLEKVKGLIPMLGAVFFLCSTALVAWTLLGDNFLRDNYIDRPWTVVFPALALGSTILAWRLMKKGSYLGGLLASGATIGLLMATIAAGLYPVMLPSSTDMANSLTVHNAASAEETLMVMFVMAAIGIPFILLYTAGVYYFFRGKVSLDEESY